MGSHAEKLKQLVDNLSDQNTELRSRLFSFGVSLGIYEGTVGGIPAGAYNDVLAALDAQEKKPTTLNELVATVRSIAAEKAAAAEASQRIEGVTPPAAPSEVPIEGLSRSPYSAPGAADDSPRLVLDSASNVPANTVQPWDIVRTSGTK